jgi:hypothetical protein
MDPNPTTREARRESDQEAWAGLVEALKVSNVPAGAVNLNVDGRPMVGPLQGFGPLWEKTYQVRLSGANVTPDEVIRVWKERFPSFHPKTNRFYATGTGIAPGQVVLLNATLKHLPVYAGMLVLYADDQSFTLMTPMGLPESGWITCSAFEEDGATVAQVQTFGRSNDPFFEIGFRLFGASAQEEIWLHVLRSLARNFGVEAEPRMFKTLLDPRYQWRQARNVWYNATLRSIVYQAGMPLRWIQARRGAQR